MFHEKCYLFYNKGPPWKSWEDSRKYCQNTAADLAVIGSLQEQVSSDIVKPHSDYKGQFLIVLQFRFRDDMIIQSIQETENKDIHISTLTFQNAKEKKFLAIKHSECLMANQNVCLEM